MTRAQTLAKTTADLTDAESADFSAALANNATAQIAFDAIDVKRLAAYRRAARAGFYRDTIDGESPALTLLTPIDAAPHTHVWRINGRVENAPCTRPGCALNGGVA